MDHPHIPPLQLIFLTLHKTIETINSLAFTLPLPNNSLKIFRKQLLKFSRESVKSWNASLCTLYLCEEMHKNACTYVQTFYKSKV